METWRPGNWENPHPPAQFHPVGLIYRDVFEAGADAMYQACRERLGKMAFLLEEIENEACPNTQNQC